MELIISVVALHGRFSHLPFVGTNLIRFNGYNLSPPIDGHPLETAQR